MGEDLGHGGKGGNGDGCINLQPVENFNQVLISMNGDAMLFGNRDDLGGNRASTFGEDPWEIIPISVIAEGDGGFWIFGHHPTLSTSRPFTTPRALFISW